VLLDWDREAPGNAEVRRRRPARAVALEKDGRQGVIWLASQHLSTICYRK
jgi:hypothetical protein